MGRLSRADEPTPPTTTIARPPALEKVVLLYSADPELARLLQQDQDRHGLAVETISGQPAVHARLKRGGVQALIVDLAGGETLSGTMLLQGLAFDPPAFVPIVALVKPTGVARDQVLLLDSVCTALVSRALPPAELWRQILGTMQPTSPRLATPKVMAGKSVKIETRCPDLAKTLEDIELVAAHDVTVLLVGETGSGKTTLAQLIHESSPRAPEKFMHLACGALPPTLIESELFGHIKGSFTGADRNKAGKFEAAGAGTLLLDEIDTLSLEQQVKLLRVIETGQFEPVGSNETRDFVGRLIVASNVCLDTLVASQRFRQDLFYRFNVLKFQMPALRDRQSDIVPLALEFVQSICSRCRITIDAVHPDFLLALKRYHWPGNLRELRNCMERAVVLSRGTMLAVECLPSAVAESGRQTPDLFPAPSASLLGAKLSESEQTIIADALHRHRYRRAPAARELGISRVTLYNKMRKYGLTDLGRTAKSS